MAIAVGGGYGSLVARRRLERLLVLPAEAKPSLAFPWLLWTVWLTQLAVYVVQENAEARAMGDHPGEPFSPNVLRTYRDVFAQRNLNEADFIGKLNHRALVYIRAHPGYVVQTMAWNIPRVFDVQRRGSFTRRFEAQELEAIRVGRIASPGVFLGALYAVFALALLGVAAQARLLPARGAPAFVWGVPLLLLLPALAIYGLPRYRAPIDPFLVMLAAVGLVAAVDRFTGRTEPD